MFKPCPNCGFLVALIAGREASQRCPRCGSAMLEEGELPPMDEATARARDDVETPAHRMREPASDDSSTAATGGSATSAAEDPIVQAHGPESSYASIAATPRSGSDPRLDASKADTTDSPHVDSDMVGSEPPPAGEPEVPYEAANASKRAASSTPSFASRRERSSPRRAGRRWPWIVALPLLALLLAVQLLLSQRTELAQSARWRPWVAGLCTVLACEVPAWREPRAFAMLARNVRPHATRAGVLHVTTSLRNDARWPQPLPVVVLSLSDVEGRVLAARAVRPTDYSRRPATLVAPGDSVDIAFDVREPSPRVVSFDFQLR